MAGSLRAFLYDADDGTDWALLGDESNIEAVNGQGNNITAATKYKVPSNLKVRSATYANAAGTIRRTIPVLSAATFGSLASGSTITDQVSGETLQLRFTKGEVVSLLPIPDTALNDGDDDAPA